MARPGRKRGPRAQAGEPREVIVDATVIVLATQGFSATSARAVAEQAGIAAGGVFYHFGSMDELLVDVYGTCVDRRISRLRAAFEHAGDEGLSGSFAAAIREELSHPEARALLELVVGSITSPVLSARVREGLQASFAFTEEVLAAVLADSPLAEVFPLDLVAQAVASAFFGLGVVDLVGAEVDIEGLTALADLVLAPETRGGLRVSGAGTE